MSETEIKYGLAGVVTDTTSVSQVMPEVNSLTYRGYAVQDLAASCCFEEVAYLLLYGELPTHTQLLQFQQEERKLRGIDPNLKSVINLFCQDAHPMDLVRTAVSFLGQSDPATHQNTHESNLWIAQKLYAALPTIVAAISRTRVGKELIDPDPDLSYSENVFHMFFGKIPEPDVIKCFDISMILYAEHSFNASTFTARVVTSTTSDIYSATTAAIGALKGALHGGANEAVMEMMLEIDDPDQAENWLKQALTAKRKIMGFGHRVYRGGDSRVPTMRDAFFQMCDIQGIHKWVQMYQNLEKTMLDEKGIYPNLDFPAGPAYYLMNFEIPMFTPLFVMARTPGWSAHVFEQHADNKLIRPLSAYTGEDLRSVPPINQR